MHNYVYNVCLFLIEICKYLFHNVYCYIYAFLVQICMSYKLLVIHVYFCVKMYVCMCTFSFVLKRMNLYTHNSACVLMFCVHPVYLLVWL